VDGASLRAIARLARTNVGMVVYYFPTKDALFFAVLDDGYAVLIADLARVKRRTRLAACSPKEREVMRLVAREALSAAPKRRRALDRFFRTRVKSFNGLPDPDELARVATELLLA
jgi:AcrR family transcriptional regulator